MDLQRRIKLICRSSLFASSRAYIRPGASLIHLSAIFDADPRPPRSTHFRRILVFKFRAKTTIPHWPSVYHRINDRTIENLTSPQRPSSILIPSEPLLAPRRRSSLQTVVDHHFRSPLDATTTHQFSQISSSSRFN